MADIADLTIRIKSQQARKAAKDLDSVDKEAKKVSKSSAKVTTSFNKQSAAAKRLNQSLSGTTRLMAGLLAGFTAFAAARSTVNVLANFSDTMATVRAIAVPTNLVLEEQVKLYQQLRDAAAEAGARTRFTATQAAEAQLFLARAGFQAQEIISALPGTLNLAAAGAVDLGRAADIASNAMAQFGIRADEMNRVSNVLVTTANNSNTSVEQLGEAMKFAGPFAAALGKSFEEVAAAAGALGDAGIQASLAGTNLRGVLAFLLAPATEKASEALADIAERAGDTEDAFKATERSLLEMFSTFAKGKTTAEEFELIFGRRNVSAAIALTNAIDKFASLSEKNFKSQGEAARVAAIRNDTLKGSLLALRSAFEGLQLQQQGFAGALRDTVDVITDAFRILGGFASEEERANESAQNLIATMETLVFIVKVLIGLRVISFFLGVARAMKAAAAAQALFTAASLTNPWILLATAIATAVVALDAYTGAAKRADRASQDLARTRRRLEVTTSRSEADAIRAELARAEQTKNVERQLSAVRRLAGEVEAALTKAAGPGTGGKLFSGDVLTNLFGSPEEVQAAAEKAGVDLSAGIVDAFIADFVSRRGDLPADELAKELATTFLFVLQSEGTRRKNQFADALIPVRGQEELTRRIGAITKGIFSPENAARIFGAGEVTLEAIRDAVVASFRTGEATLEDGRKILEAEATRLAALQTKLAEVLAEAEKSGVKPPTEAERRAKAQREAIEAFEKGIQQRKELAQVEGAAATATLRAAQAAEKLADRLKLGDKARQSLVEGAKREEAEIQRIIRAKEKEKEARDLRDEVKETTQALREENEVREAALQGGEDAARQAEINIELRALENDLIKVGAQDIDKFVDARRRELESARDLDKAQDDLNKKRAEERRAQQESARASQRSANNLQVFVEQLTSQVNELGRSRQEIAEFNTQQEAFNVLTAAGVPNAAALADQLGNLARAFVRVQEKAGKGEGKGVGAELANLMMLLKEFVAEARSLGIPAADELADAYERMAKALEDVQKNLEKTGQATDKAIPKLENLEKNLAKIFSEENLDRISSRLGDAFGIFVEDILTETETLKDALENLAKDLLNIFVQEFVGNPIRILVRSLSNNLFGSIFSPAADGRVMEHGRFKKFAAGGVIDSPVTFPMRDGMGLAGEAGPEAILPLRRGPDGKLGVTNNGSGGGQTVTQDNRTVNVKLVLPGVKDADSFRRSRRQVTQDLSRIGGAL